MMDRMGSGRNRERGGALMMGGDLVQNVGATMGIHIHSEIGFGVSCRTGYSVRLWRWICESCQCLMNALHKDGVVPSL